MNGDSLPIPHGIPLRLRAETQLGCKMVKWIRSIEFVSAYQNIGWDRAIIEKTTCIKAEAQEFNDIHCVL
jgi:DMSO/TMAO reductase YedYZ molybdopterin-dependent catalytic subunit